MLQSDEKSREDDMRFPPSRARELRKVQTPAEDALWDLLRDRRLQRLKFRRQMPISIYFADFYCHALKLIVELDGEIHDAPRQRVHDKNRDTPPEISRLHGAPLRERGRARGSGDRAPENSG